MPLTFDPGSYHLTEMPTWPSFQFRLEYRIAAYAGETGMKFAVHHMRVAADALGFILYLGYSDNAAWNIRSALLFHDIGKTHTDYDPDIWELPHRPTHEERSVKRLHTRRGVEVFDTMLSQDPDLPPDHPHFKTCRAIILYHHERLNGSKYENVTELPEWMQAVAICDTYDGDRVRHPHQDHRRSPEETIKRMMAESEDGEKYEGAYAPGLMAKFAQYKL